MRPHVQHRLLKSRPKMLLLAALLPLAVLGAESVNDFVPTNEPNMNGDYVFTATPGGTPGLFPKAYKDYPRGVE